MSVRRWAVAAAGWLLVGPAIASADGSSSSPYRVSWRTELPVLAAAAVASASPYIFKRDLGSDACPCSRDEVNGFDRSSTGKNSSAADHASTVAAGLLVAGPFALEAAELGLAAGARPALIADGAVIVESMAVTAGLTQIAKAAARRPRPFLYGLAAGDPALAETDNYRSFFSAHTSIAFAAAVSYARTFAYRHPERRARWAVYGAALLGGGAVAALRVEAGQHFPSDVLTGALVGSAAGLAVPALRHRGAGETVSLVPRRDGWALAASIPLP